MKSLELEEAFWLEKNRKLDVELAEIRRRIADLEAKLKLRK